MEERKAELIVVDASVLIAAFLPDEVEAKANRAPRGFAIWARCGCGACLILSGNQQCTSDGLPAQENPA